MPTASSAYRMSYLSLGSNLGDRVAHLRAAEACIAVLPHTRIVATSSVLETPPWGKTDQPAFLNMAIAIETTLDPETLLTALQEIEESLGRHRTEHWGPRTIDIDILFYAGEIRHTETLQLPHPYLTQRRFVLVPLAEIASDLIISGKTVCEWLEALL